MAANTPDDVNRQLVAAINKGDIESALSLYEENAAFVTAEGTAVGHKGIREALEGFISIKPQLSMESKETVITGDVALARGEWKLTGTDPEGGTIEMSGRSMEVIRRQADGSWLFAIDHPTGAD